MIAALAYIIEAVTNLVLFILLLRFWMPWFRVDFRNDVAQAILKVTAPLVIPLRRILPPIGRIDTATVVATIAIQYLGLLVLIYLYSGSTLPFVSVLYTSVLMLAILSCYMFMLIIFVSILLGWFAPYVHNPVTAMVYSISEPLLRPFRRLIPALGGFDISPVIPLILLGATTRLLASLQPFAI